MSSMSISTEVETGIPPEATREEKATKLGQLKAAATRQYALKNYSEAAELYSEATELQVDLNGEMSVDNAELLYLYGRCLYNVGVSKSDVLGGKVAQQDEPQRKKRKLESANAPAGPSDAQVEYAPVENKLLASANEMRTASQSAYFQITGDEAWSDTEPEEEPYQDEEDGENDDDDFAISYEILDTARVLIQKKIAMLEEAGKEDPKVRQEIRALKERLADTHDIQAEIKLENEQFDDAVKDAREALALKLSLYPPESGLIAEGHYKLSIALDFASLPTQPADEDGKPIANKEVGQVDENMRREALEEMEKAILVVQARLQNSEATLPTVEGAKLEELKKSIADGKDMIKEMRVRCVDLRKPVAGPADPKVEVGTALQGILGQMGNLDESALKAKLAQAAQNANDLSGLVKQKKRPKQADPAPEYEGKGKRKAEDEVPSSDDTKKVKVDGATEA